MQKQSYWRRIGYLGLVVTFYSVFTSRAIAQVDQDIQFHQYQPQIKNHPTISPYMGLVQIPGNQTGLNYFNIVRPQQRSLKSTGRLTSELNSFENRVQALQRPQAVPTQPVRGATSVAPDAISSGRMLPSGHATAFGKIRGFPSPSRRR